MNLLLDTCVILWLSSERNTLTDTAKEAIAASRMVYVSPASAWEIGLKQSKGLLKLPDSVEEWWNKVLEKHKLLELPLSGKIAARSTNLPPLHQDPADRMLIATAQSNDLELVTPDKTIWQYPNLRTLW